MADEKTEKQRKDQDVVSHTSFTGLRNTVTAERFDPKDLDLGQNINLDASGRIARRDGATKRVSVNAHSLWAKDTFALFVSGAQLYKLNTDFSIVSLAAGLTPNATMSYAPVNDLVYASNGNQTAVVSMAAGATRSWGLPVPALPTAVVDVTGGLSAGTYQFTGTYLRGDGQESGAIAAGAVTVLDGQGIHFTFPDSSAPEVVQKNLYVSQPNGDVLFLVATMPVGTTTYTVNPNDLLAMNVPLSTQFLQAPPAGQIVAYYRGQMFVAVGDTIYVSEPYGYELFDLRKYIPLDGPVTLMAPMEDKGGAPSGFFVGTTKSCGLIIGDSPENFEYVPRQSYGAVSGSLTTIDGALFGEGETGARPLPMWLSTQGVCIGMPSMEINNLTRSKYSFAMDLTGSSVFMPDAQRFITMTSSTTALVMNTETQALTTYSGFTYNSLVRFNGSTYGASAAGIYELVGDNDDGTPIDARARTSISDFGTAFRKRVERVYVGYNSQNDMTLKTITDGGVSYTYTLPGIAEVGMRGNRVKLGKGVDSRYWQFEIANVGGAYFTIDTIDVQPLQTKRRVDRGSA